MSGQGSPHLKVDGQGLNITIVAGQWHLDIVEALLKSAERILIDAGASTTVVRVAGAFEIPVIAQSALNNGADAVVALAVIIRGGTPHFEYIADAVTTGLLRVSLDSGRPVGFGVLTVDDEQQARDRSGLPGSTEDKGIEAAQAALNAALVLRDLNA